MTRDQLIERVAQAISVACVDWLFEQEIAVHRWDVPAKVMARAAVDVVLEETDAALKRKDAVLRKAMGALLDAANCIDDMGFNSEREEAAIAAIDAELNETEGEEIGRAHV